MKVLSIRTQLKSTIVLSFLLCLFPVCIDAQNDTTSSIVSWALQGHAGRLVKIHGEYPENDISTVTEAQMMIKTRGNKPWQAAQNFPSYGLSLVHAQFGNQDILGQAIGFLPMMRYEKWMKKSFFSFRAGLGIAWFNKPYNINENPRNLVIGSSLANISIFSLEWHKLISKHLAIKLGGSFTHCSGAHVAVPNIGANLPAITAGIAYSPVAFTEYGKQRKNFVESKPHGGIGLHFNTGFHEFSGTIRPVDGIRYLVFGTSIYYMRAFNNKGNVSLGFNGYYYQGYRDYIHSQELYGAESNLKNKPYSAIVYAGYEKNFRRVSFFVEAGLNIYDPVLRALNEVWDLPKHGWLHQHTANKIGYRVYLFPQDTWYRRTIQPYLHIAVKTNGGTADFLEFAIGTVIKKRFDSITLQCE